MSETCQDCKSIDASFICVCLERHLCDNCLLTHISHAEGNEHRPVSLSHPLLTLLLQASEVASNAEESIINSNVPHKIQVIENQVKNLERFKERTNSLVNLKIQNLKAEMKKTPEQNPMEIAKKPDIPQLQTPKFNFSPERPISSLSSIRKEDYVKPLYLDRPSSRIQFSANKIWEDTSKSLQFEDLASTSRSWTKPIDDFKLKQSTNSHSTHVIYQRLRNSLKINNSHILGETTISVLSKSARNNRSSYKIILIGDSAVGKTTILSNFMSNHGSYHQKSGISNASRMISFEENSIEANIWDVSFTSNLSSISKSCMYGACGAVMLFDLTRDITFLGIEKRIDDFSKESDSLSVIILVGTRLDLVAHNPRSRFISFERAQYFAQSKGILYDEICSLNSDHVNELFKRLMKEIYHRRHSVALNY